MSWTPGYRRTPPGLSETFGDSVAALAVASVFKAQVFIGTSQTKRSDSDLADDSPPELGNDVILHLSSQKGARIAINLAGLTIEELNVLRDAVNIAFDMGEKVAAIRDQEAEEAANRGEDFFYRRHRGAPRLSRFERTIAAHEASLPHRHQDDVGGDGAGGDRPGGPGEDRSGVANVEAQNTGSEVDGSASHVSEVSGSGSEESDPR